MQEINWDKLQAYSGDNKKSFEELCYQIVYEEYKDDIVNGAILTSVDDSGGGDGVEFYITNENGEVFGWQAKFFCRLSEGGRKEQIKKSLQTAYKKHPNLKKWFLCSKCGFTPDEKTWFDDTLASSTKNGERVLAEKHSVELIHWGESELLNYLKDYPAIHKFFFSEKLLTQEWFKERYEVDVQKVQIKTKYESQIHIQTNIDTTINKILGANRLVEILDNEMENQQVKMYAEEYKHAFFKLFSEDVKDEYKDIQTEFRNFSYDKDNIIEVAINKLSWIKQSILNKDENDLKDRIKEFDEYINTLRGFLQGYNKLTESDLCNPIKHTREEYEAVQGNESALSKEELEEIKKENKKRSKVRDILFAPLYALDEYAISSLENCFRVFELLNQNELHISGNAGMGKTHISFNIYEDQVINQKQPAIFVFAKDIDTEQKLESQLKNNFDVPADWSFDDFLGALEITARVNKTKLPIIIDGLNESTHWNSVWKNGLENLIIKLKKYSHIVLVTTYRTSYEDQLFPDKYFDYKYNKDWWKLKETVHGFEGLTWEAIKTYFEFYKIKLDNRSNAIGYFNHPLHLKLFCATKNPNRAKEVEVSFQNEDLFEVFDEYIQISNKNITTLLKELDPKYDNNFTEKKLLQLSKYFWDNNTRGISRSEELFTNDELRVLEGENLLIYRDWNTQENKEEIQFTYDLLGGYFISKYLIQTYEEYYPYLKYNSDNWFVNSIKTGLEFFIPERGTELIENGLNNINKKIGKKQPLLKFIKSKDFRKKLLEQKTEHPLYDDILRTFAILLIKKGNIFLFDILEDKRAEKYSIESLFEINSESIKKNEKLVKSFLEKEFMTNKANLINLSKNIEFDTTHPLNFSFWSDVIKDMAMLERDLFWSEYVRKNHSWYGNSYFTNIIKNFEKACIREKKLSGRIHLGAKKVMWVFTTNIRKLRDEATKALYYYARRYPKEFLELLEYSLDINDPYIPERMLAVSYGLAMARQNDFKDKSYKKEYLAQYGKLLYDSIFSKNAKYNTTHILARDYAKRTIDIALLHYPSLLNSFEKESIQYPLHNYPHLHWEEITDNNKGEYRDGNAPIHMDFKNYTIGRLIEGRRNYDNKHNEYKQVLSQIYWRIYDLGYSLEKFGEIDKNISSDNWHYSNHENTGHIDRYGKKYSWIAFYEMAGYRSDLGLLKGWEDEDEFRISDVDLDPSFPIELKEYNLFEELKSNNFLGNEELPPESWYEVDNDLNIKEYIELNSNFGCSNTYEWVLLKGNISQKDSDEQTRDIHISINAILVDENDFKKVDSIINQYNDYTFDYLRNIENHYLFEGEIPWCDLVPEEYSKDFEIFYNYHDVEKTKKDLKILKNGKELTESEATHLKEKENEYLEEALGQSSDTDFKINLPFIFKNGKDDELTKKTAETLGYSFEYEDVSYIETEYENIDINIDTTIFENSWESHHSEIISSGETKVPSKEICNSMSLFIKPQSSDLYNETGEIVSTSFKYGKGYDNTSRFTYIRKDYLDKYLEGRNKKILWLQWSEKRYFPNGVKELSLGGGREKTEYRTHYNIILL